MTMPTLPWLLFAVLASTPAPELPALCSMVPFSGFRPDTGVFVGTPTPDSVRAGPGSVEYAVGPGHSGYGQEREIYGQVFEAERYMDPGPGLDGEERVVVVPWDYGPGCRPVPWGRSAVWVADVERGLLRGSLRPEELWVEDMPTYDVRVPEFGWYTGVPFRVFGRTPEVDDALSVDELFELYTLLPTWRQAQARGWDAADPALAWMRERTPDGTAYPVPFIASELVRAAEDHRARQEDLRVRGTWEVSVELPSGRVETVYWRTSSRAEGAWHEPTPPPRQDTTWVAPWEQEADGSTFHFWWAREPEGLPGDSASAVRAIRGAWPIAVVDTVGTVEWRARLEPDEVERWLPENEEVTSVVARSAKAFYERWSSGRASFLEGRFFVVDDTLRFEQSIGTDAGESIRIRGRRISMEAVDRTR